ncbi:MAG TPA: ATP-binding protein, partial [Ktedonobacteraceae bacterium]|nr:ATP-binding protein [Ktedonobacteraceae bacterium]
MERLNDILGRIPQHRQQNMERHQDPSLRGQEITPSRYPARELGSGSRASQPQYQHKIPPRARYEQGKYSQQGYHQPYSRQQLSGRGVPYQSPAQHQVDSNSHGQYEDDYVPRNRGKMGITSADAVDEYPILAGSDVREEWIDDTGDMLYGDWEEDGNDPNMRMNPQVTGTVLHQRSSIYPAPSRETQTYHESNRSFVTRDLHMTPNGGQRSQTTRHPGDYYVQSVPHVPNRPASQEVQQPIRMTQPLKPQLIMRSNQEGAQEGIHSQPLAPQSVRRDQVQQNSAIQSCSICKGAGYLRADVPFGHPNFGKPIACECKEAERKAKRRQQLQEMSDLGAFYDKSFRNFNVHVPGIQEAYNCACEFAQDPNGWLLLIGPNGSGKTHLAAAIANKSLEDGALVLFATVPDLLDHLRAAFAPTSNEVYDQLFSRMREAEVLVLDDLGAQ